MAKVLKCPCHHVAGVGGQYKTLDKYMINTDNISGGLEILYKLPVATIKAVTSRKISKYHH
jgi:hypothetical protein